jgi:hypothetical protein
MFVRSLLIALLLVIFQPLKLQGQDACGNERYREHLGSHGLLQAFDQANRQVMESSQALGQPTDEVLVIPVVVHIFHLGEPVGTGTNISDQQILDALAAANERWRNLNGDGIDMEVEFCLARFDPEGNPSTGIVRFDASGVPNYSEYGISYLGGQGANELQLKGRSNWPHNYVYNIWVVNKIAGGWAGFAMFPLNFNFLADGTVMDYRYMTRSSATLAHELGHGMMLFHTFEGENNGCPPNQNCNIQGDWVCDTPPHRKNECSTTTCSGSGDPALSFRNIMSYCGNNRGIFSEGQKTRSRTAIKTTSRKALLNSSACGYRCPEIEETVAATTCVLSEAGTIMETFVTELGCDSVVTTITTYIPPPVAAFSYTIGEGGQVLFDNLSENGNTYTWDFGDGMGSHSSDPEHTYGSGGTYTVTLTTTNDCDSDVTEETIFLSPSGIHDHLTAADIQVYPNPGDGRFTLLLSSLYMTQVQIRITDITGREVLMLSNAQVAAGKITLQTNLPHGVYLLQVKTQDMTFKAIPVMVY